MLTVDNGVDFLINQLMEIAIQVEEGMGKADTLNQLLKDLDFLLDGFGIFPKSIENLKSTVSPYHDRQTTAKRMVILIDSILKHVESRFPDKATKPTEDDPTRLLFEVVVVKMKDL